MDKINQYPNPSFKPGVPWSRSWFLASRNFCEENAKRKKSKSGMKRVYEDALIVKHPVFQQPLEDFQSLNSTSTEIILDTICINVFSYQFGDSELNQY